MYSRKERMRAIKLYIKYDKCAADVARELGYPDRKSLREWYKEYLKGIETGVVWDEFRQPEKYTQEQKQIAVDHFLEHDHNITRTVRNLGYQSRETLRHCMSFMRGSFRPTRPSISLIAFLYPVIRRKLLAALGITFPLKTDSFYGIIYI